jgi:hypothetical protein
MTLLYTRPTVVLTLMNGRHLLPYHEAPALERALRKIIADAAASAVFHLFCLVDGVFDLPGLADVSARIKQ